MWKAFGTLVAIAAIQAQVEAAPAPAVVTIWQTATKVVYANGDAYTTIPPLSSTPSPIAAASSAAGGFDLDNLLQQGKISEWLAYFKGSSQTPDANTVALSTPSTIAQDTTTTSYPSIQAQVSTSPNTPSVATTSSSTAAASTNTGSSSLSSFQQNILDAHNVDRAKHGSGALTWDSTLQSYAQDYADKYDCSGVLTHSGGPYGENLACGYSDGPSAVQAWYDEGKTYNYGSSSTYDHFTQVVWKSTTKLGCAYKDCRSNNWGLYIICSYDPAGNVIGQSAANVLPPQ